MFFGAHLLLYSANPDADRAFVRDVLGFKSVDVGRGWLIFKLPPAEVAIHPAGGEDEDAPEPAEHRMAGAVLYLMCTDLTATASALASRGVRCTAIARESWGIRTTIPLPSGAEIGLYQPTHPTALELA
jgi:hypothetical protein